MTPERARRPAAGPPRPYHFPAFERQTLGNGVRMITARVSKLPLVSIVALVDAGAAQDPVSRDGLATLSAKLLLEGTEHRDGAALVDAFEQLGATVDVGAGWDSAVVQLTVLRANVEAALALLREVLRAPAFRERDVMRLKAERLAERLQVRTEPRELADESFGRFLYSTTSRYAYPEAGRTASIAATTPDDVRSFYRRLYVPGRLTMIIVGDIDHGTGAELVAQAFGDWTGTTDQSVGEITDATNDGTRRIQIVGKADAPQSELRIGHRGLPRKHPDHFKTVVMNAVLGGLFSSRINLNLRERHGYAYGAHSSFEWRRNSGPFVVSTAVESGVTADATREVLAEIERMREAPISADELSLATSYMEGVFPIRYESTAAITGALTALVTYGYPADYFDTYREHISLVSVDDVLQMARTHLHPDRLLVLAVGDPAAIEAPLTKLNVGLVSVAGADEIVNDL